MARVPGKAWSTIERTPEFLSEATVLAPVHITSLSSQSFLQLLFHPLMINLFSFFLLSLISFRHNAAYLFHGLDGRYEVSLVALSSLFVPALPGFTNDFIHGLGDIWFSVNPWFLPEYFLSLSRQGDFNDFPLAYAISATELFAATFVAGRLIGVSRPSALIGAWLVPLLTFQYAGWNLVPSTFRAFPHYATIAGVTVLVAVMLLLIGQLPRRKAALAAAFAFLGISYIIIVTPTLLILGSPLLAISGLVSLVAARRQPHFKFRIAVMAAIPAASVALGYPSFLIGLTADSAAEFFRNLSIPPGTLDEASMLFWNPVHPVFFTVERSFILLGLCGGAWVALRAQGVLRIGAIAFIATELLYLTVGIAHAFHPFWFGPAPWYFEDFITPLHAIFAAVLLSEPLRIIVRLWSARHPTVRTPVLAVLLPIAIAAVPWLYVHHRQMVVGPPDLPYYEPYPQRDTAMTRILKEEIALKLGAPFRGREATLTGRIFPLSTNVDILGLSSIPDVLAMQSTGNLHSYAGLWQDAIPTLLEYNPLMTPAYFAFGRTFFTEPADRQIRNILAMRRIDPRILAAVGVRFVVTDAPFDGDAHLRQTIPVPVTPDMVSRLGLPQRVLPLHIASFALYLYELDHVNVGQYSPIEIHRAATASTMLDALSDPSLDLARTAVTSTDLQETLVPAAFGGFIVERGHFRLKATSGGWSLLVLPMEFSRCLHLDNKSDTSGARLVRVDLLLTGVLFSKTLDARLTYHTGPFVGSRCRIEDARDMEAINIKDAFQHRQNLAPIPIKSY